MRTDLDKGEKRVYNLLLDTVYSVVPTTNYMDAENRATLADLRWRNKYGDDFSDTLGELRGLRDNVLSDAVELARNIAKLQRAVEGRKAPQPEVDGLFASLEEIFKGFPSLRTA